MIASGQLDFTPLCLPNPVSLVVKCSVAMLMTRPRVEGLNSGSSPEVSVGSPRWCAITHVPSYSLIRSEGTSLKPGGVFYLDVGICSQALNFDNFFLFCLGICWIEEKDALF